MSRFSLSLFSLCSLSLTLSLLWWTNVETNVHLLSQDSKSALFSSLAAHFLSASSRDCIYHISSMLSHIEAPLSSCSTEAPTARKISKPSQPVPQYRYHLCFQCTQGICSSAATLPFSAILVQLQEDIRYKIQMFSISTQCRSTSKFSFSQGSNACVMSLSSTPDLKDHVDI